MSDKGGCNQVIASDNRTEEEKQKRGGEESWEGWKDEEAVGGLLDSRRMRRSGIRCYRRGEDGRRISLTLGNI